MADDTRYAIRQLILQALVERKAPHTLNDLCQSSGIACEGYTREDIRAELPGLVDHGYIRDLMPTRGGMYVIEAKGRDQHTLDAERDEYIYGKWGLR